MSRSTSNLALCLQPNTRFQLPAACTKKKKKKTFAGTVCFAHNSCKSGAHKRSKRTDLKKKKILKTTHCRGRGLASPHTVSGLWRRPRSRWALRSSRWDCLPSTGRTGPAGCALHWWMTPSPGRGRDGWPHRWLTPTPQSPPPLWRAWGRGSSPHQTLTHKAAAEVAAQTNKKNRQRQITKNSQTGHKYLCYVMLVTTQTVKS